MREEEIIVVGAGASGMMAALEAARAGGKVLILEKMDRPGKKLLATGNGKCNFTNRYQDVACYRGEDQRFIQRALQRFSYEETLRAFRGMGVLSIEKNGYVYPRSEQAASVADALVRCLNDCRVRIQARETVKDIWAEINNQGQLSEKKSFCYVIETDKGRYRTGKLILAVGGAAAPVQGTAGDGYAFVKKLGLQIKQPLPALTSLVLKGNDMRGWAGVRAQGKISLFTGEGKLLAEDAGELQMVDYGLSGIPVFQVSRFAAEQISRGDQPYLLLDIMPEQTAGQLEEELKNVRERFGRWTAADALHGFLHKKLAKVLLKCAGMDPGGSVRKWTDSEISCMVNWMKQWRLDIREASGFEKAQVTAGGVLTEQIDPDTMEVKGYPGLYVTGELLDVDGICGGYNLQWAWTSGYLAGRAAGKL